MGIALPFNKVHMYAHAIRLCPIQPKVRVTPIRSTMKTTGKLIVVSPFSGFILRYAFREIRVDGWTDERTEGQDFRTVSSLSTFHAKIQKDPFKFFP